MKEKQAALSTVANKNEYFPERAEPGLFIINSSEANGHGPYFFVFTILALLR